MRTRYYLERLGEDMKNGFSLVELMIVLGIIGILAAIAYPSYNEYTTRAHRADGQSALLDLATRMERYYSENNTYATATVAAGNGATDVLGTNISPDGWYTLSITAQGAGTFTVQATPRLEQANRDTRCQSLTYNNLGQKGITNGPAGAPTGTVAQCW
jgi:type IV pilus assembly protein PilE